MPGPNQFLNNMRTLFLEDIFAGTRPAFLEILRDARAADVPDESIGSFIARRFGSERLVDNIASAFFHGVYAGNVWNLSARTLLPGLWEQEVRDGSLMAAWGTAAFEKKQWRFCDDLECQFQIEKEGREFADLGKGVSVFSFKGGLEKMVEALMERLAGTGRVEVRWGQTARVIERVGQGDECEGVTVQSPETYVV